MSSTTQSTDYKQLGVQDVCEIKNYPYYDERKGVLGNTITRKIFEIIEREGWNLSKALPDLAYLAARNDGLDPDETELGALMKKITDLANKGVKNEDIKEYMKGVVMAVYVFESLEEDTRLANKYLGCQKK